MSASTSSSSAPKPSKEELDIDKILNREASAFQREVEVERILKAFRLKCLNNPLLCYPLLTVFPVAHTIS